MKLYNGMSCQLAKGEQNIELFKMNKNGNNFDRRSLEIMECDRKHGPNFKNAREHYTLILIRFVIQNMGCQPTRIEVALCKAHADRLIELIAPYIHGKIECIEYDLKGVE